MKRLVVRVGLGFAFVLAYQGAALGATYHVYACGPWSSSTGPFVAAHVPGTSTSVFGCGGGQDASMSLQRFGTPAVPHDEGASWSTTAPAGLSITHVSTVNDSSGGVGDGHGWYGAFFWNGGAGPAGQSSQLTDTFSQYGCCQAALNNQSVGWFMVCGWSSCTQDATVSVGGVDMTVDESQGPSLVAPSGLWQSTGWVRGTWPFVASGDSPSGLCWLSVTLNGQQINTTTSGRNVATWHQCAAGAISQSVDTTRYGQGAVPLSIGAGDAAGIPASVSKTVYIDNSIPTISLSGPVDAPSTAGTQYVSASSGGSPSGIADIICSVDGGPAETYSGASAQVPVSGIGLHAVSCHSQDNATDPSGVHGRSTTSSWSLKIGQPTEVGIAFNKLVGLRCRRVTVHLKIQGHWITVRRHGKRVKIKTRARTKVERVQRCHPRTERKRTVVFVRERRDGHMIKVRRVKFERVVVPPRVIAKTSRAVAFGRSTTVDGYLGTASGIAIANHPVQVLTAPDNGSGQFSQAAVVTTAANGAWVAKLPPGPSRIVEAVYGGDPTTEGASSGQVHVVVPAKVKLLSVSPRRVAWAGTVRITGQLLGGYLPAGGALVRLRIGQGKTYQTYGVQEHVTGNGRFTTTYTFGAGDPAVSRTFWFQIATLPMGDYSYAPAASGRKSVIVGGHPRSSSSAQPTADEAVLLPGRRCGEGVGALGQRRDPEPEPDVIAGVTLTELVLPVNRAEVTCSCTP
jgi:hypothetical protein